jgi:peptidoglycan LD-endopeptidase LytH
MYSLFMEWAMLQRPFFAALVHPRPDIDNAIAVDLSREHPGQLKNMRDPKAFENFLNLSFEKSGALMGLGGYLEARNLYSDAEIFNNESARDERYIHLGVDIWMAASTEVFAPLEGKIHSFADNIGYGNYGPTIILEHNPASEIRFYTLYGHLSRSDLQAVSIGMKINKGQCFAHFGNDEENGNWSPHLHFQIILNMGEYLGDYPGVASENMLKFEKYNCPDPNIIINCPLI